MKNVSGLFIGRVCKLLRRSCRILERTRGVIRWAASAARWPLPLTASCDGPDRRLGWTDEALARWRELGEPAASGRVSRLDRGWSTVLVSLDEPPLRMRNIGADVAVGDFVVVSDDGERVQEVLPRRSAFVRRASFEGNRAEAHTIAANIDVVMLLHALTSPPNQRRLERELVLAWDSGARPVVVLTKTDLVDDPSAAVASLQDVAPGVDVRVASGITGEGVDALRHYAAGNGTIALLGASGVGKSTLVNALVGHERQATAVVREGDQRGRHTTTASELVRLPGDRVADRHARRARRQPVEQRPRHRAGLRRRVRPDGPLPVPRLQARAGARLRGERRDRGRHARPAAAGEHEAPRRRGGRAGGGAARPGEGARPPRRPQAAPATLRQARVSDRGLARPRRPGPGR